MCSHFHATAACIPFFCLDDAIIIVFLINVAVAVVVVVVPVTVILAPCHNGKQESTR